MQTDILFQNINPLSTDTASSTVADFHFTSSRLFTFSTSLNRIQINIKERVKRSWTNQEKIKYTIFVFYFRQFFHGFNKQELNWHIFKGMSQFIKSKNPQQCRSHHLKLISEFGSIENFLLHATKRIKGIVQKIRGKQKALQEIHDLFMIKVESKKQNQKQIDQNEINQSKIKSLEVSQSQVQEQKLKINKQNTIKTADSYLIQQNFYKSHNSYYVITQRPFLQTSKKPQLNRPQLPSFQQNDKWDKQMLNGQKCINETKINQYLNKND